MLVDLKVRGRSVLVLGAGASARERETALRRQGAKVVRPPRARSRSGTMGRRGSPDLGDLAGLVRKLRPDLVFSVVQDAEENRRVARSAHAVGALVHVYDAPDLSDFTLPSVGSKGAIQLAVSTSGQSPAMAALLRRRLERSIRPLDVAKVRLQGRVRREALRSLPTAEARRAVIHRLLRHREVDRRLRANRFEEAVRLARELIASSSVASADAAPRSTRWR